MTQPLTRPSKKGAHRCSRSPQPNDFSQKSLEGFKVIWAKGHGQPAADHVSHKCYRGCYPGPGKIKGFAHPRDVLGRSKVTFRTDQVPLLLQHMSRRLSHGLYIIPGTDKQNIIQILDDQN